MTKVFVAGHAGMVGSAIVRRLSQQAGVQILTRPRSELDLTDQKSVADFFADERPDQVFLAAAKVGGIHANNTYQAEFIYENLCLQTNIIHSAWQHGVDKLLFLGSSCIYPKFAAQPMAEEELLSGELEPTNEPYAIAKIAGIKMCEAYRRQYGVDFRSVMPTNLYGPGDNFHPQNSHVVPAMMRRFHEAAQTGKPAVTVWGTGNPMREFLHVDDLAAACCFVMRSPRAQYDDCTQEVAHLNIGTGQDCTIAQLAETMAEVTGFEGRLEFDPSKPDGTPRKLLNVARINALGWRAEISLEVGLRSTYRWFLEHENRLRGVA